MDRYRRSNPLQAVCYIALFLLLYLITYSDLVNLRIGNAMPLPLIAPVIAVGYFYGEWIGFTAGVLCGIFVDAVSSGVTCFNTLILLFIGCATGVLIKYYLNKNILTILTMSLVFCLLYFALKWLIVVPSGSSSGFGYFLFYALPSAIYSAAFIIPCYYLGLLIKKI